jgi:murein DD-endopeptidase MepM/ murein hydrolase activator NlpD
MALTRLTARAVLLVVATAAFGAAEATGQPNKVPPLIFPVVGSATFEDDYGDPRPQGRHEGIDIVGPKRAVVVAAEAGTIKFWTTSKNAGCMLYLNGESKTTYLYVHLNNDLTQANDNTGKCIPGVAYARGLKSGDQVTAGEPIAFLGDSGDADGITPHLHFEVHPAGGEATNPYAHLKRAKKLLLVAKPGSPFTAALRGEVVDAFDGSLTLDVDHVQSWPGSFRVKVERRVELAVPPTTVVFNPLGAVVAAAQLSALEPGQKARAWTEKAVATLAAQLGEPLSLATERVELFSS